MSNLDKYDLNTIIGKRTKTPNIISVGSSWIDGRSAFFKTSMFRKYSKAWYGLCHYGKMIWALVPIDFVDPTMITTIQVAPVDGYCQYAQNCLHFDCHLNRFDKKVYENIHKVGSFSLGLPQNIGTKTLWFNHPKYKKLWNKYLEKSGVNGAVYKFRKNKLIKL